MSIDASLYGIRLCISPLLHSMLCRFDKLYVVASAFSLQLIRCSKILTAFCEIISACIGLTLWSVENKFTHNYCTICRRHFVCPYSLQQCTLDLIPTVVYHDKKVQLCCTVEHFLPRFCIGEDPPRPRKKASVSVTFETKL